MATESSDKKPVLLWVGLAGGFLVVILCVGALVAAGATGNIWFSHTGIMITDVILTTGLDAQGRPVDNVTRFDPSVGRIYCVVTIDAPKPISLGMRWYFGDTLIMDQAQTVNNSGYMSIYRKDGTPFPEGQYRVEIYLAKEPSRTVYFTVGQ
jgi:hypothetical protein